MKKFLIIIMTLVMILNLAACGGSEAPSEPVAPVESEQKEEAAKTSEITLVTKEANFTSLLVPSDFGEFQMMEGDIAIAEGPNSNIIITNTNETDVTIEDITEEYMLGLIGNSYSNIEVLDFVNPGTVAGVDAAVIMYSGDGVTSGKNKTNCYIMMFFELEGIICEQHVGLTYDTGANTALEANLNEIIESISLN